MEDLEQVTGNAEQGNEKEQANLNKDSKSHQALLKIRCSPKAIVKIMEDMNKNSDLIKGIGDMGFSCLNHVPNIKVEHKYIKKMVDSFDVESCSLGGVAITSADISKTLGVEDGGKIIPETISKEVYSRLDTTYGKKTLSELTNSLKLFTQDDLNFRETFMLCVFGKFFCPSSKNSPSKKLYRALSVLPSTIGYNWSKFILDILVEAIKDYKNRAKGKDESSTRNMGLGGCTYFLQVFSLQKLKPLTTEMPVISAWNRKETKIAMEKIKKEKPSVDCAACVSVKQRLERLESLAGIERSARSEERPDMLEKSAFHECNSTDETQQRLARLENIILRQKISRSEKRDVEKSVSPEYNSMDNADDEPMVRAVKKSFQAGTHVSADVLYFYARHLEKTMSSIGALKISLQDTYSYKKLDEQFKMAREATLANKLNFNQHSYILFPVHDEFHYSLAIVCFPDEEANSSLFVLHLDSYEYHSSTRIFKTIEWFLKRLWANTNKPFSEIPNVITRQVKVPRQGNAYDCAFFVLHMNPSSNTLAILLL